MQNQVSFSIYNSSAGSGKTFTLVKSYLSKIIESNKPDYFKHLLAITFTNKAVGEMKERIIDGLFAFSKNSIPESHLQMFELICVETRLSDSEVQKRAKNAVNFILHNFSLFDVETIDRFNHRIIRTFAKDLKLTSNFEIELDVDLLVNEAIDQVISKVGIDPLLTKVILEFSFEKVEEDKSWDVTTDLKKVSNILYKENDLIHLEKLKNKTLEDFQSLKSNLFKQIKNVQEKLDSIAENFFNLLEKNDLETNDFSGSSLPKYFENIKTKQYYKINFNLAWQNNLGAKALYPKRVSTETASAIDAIEHQLISFFETSKNLIFELGFLNSLLKSVSSLSLINSIYKEFLTLQKEKNVLPISEFNKRVYNEIKDQPAPFIYERLGEKYKHYFIDEFQDTSHLQWSNLIPLIENALAHQNKNEDSGTLLLVGDAKQSIYRWRGGDPEQFIDLNKNTNPFPSTIKNLEQLERNYRSYDKIINFNNSFFSFVSQFFQLTSHKDLYIQGNKQKSNSKKGGFVSVSFLDATNKEKSFEIYPKEVLNIIKKLLKENYTKSEICILVRKNSQGVVLAEYLSKNNIDVISSEALLINNSPEVLFILNILKIINDFNDKKARADAFYFLHSHLKQPTEKHDFIENLISLQKSELEKALASFGIIFDFSFSTTTPLYELCEIICRNFSLSKTGIAYIQSFLELVYEFSGNESTTIIEFLEYWKTKGIEKSIEISDQLDAVSIMTVHKSKGLEFPVVIYPFADDDLYSFKNDTVWYPLESNRFSGFSEMLLPVKKELETYGSEGKNAFENHKIKAELDKINIVYVAMTRAVEHLYVLTNSNTKEKENFTSSFFLQVFKIIQ
ncbi:UvrD-helicase domain-containing protein [uncultured Planktosalinus sp.]|uniref:UvrD-helicase domain-containing protein n=1 Tax=uncultured Planktosalinus sp. TaxID=1810935 RepID=UPI0030D7C905